MYIRRSGFRPTEKNGVVRDSAEKPNPAFLD